MSLSRLLRALWPSLVETPAAKADDSSIVARIVCRYSRGNANLQRGSYVTAAQIEERKLRLAQHAF